MAVKSRTWVSTVGLIGVVAGVVGALLAFVLILWPQHTAEQFFRYPFTVAEFTVFQSIFAVQHVGLAAPLLALARSVAASGRLFGIGAWLAAAAMAVFAVVELVAITYSEADVQTANEGVMGSLYGIVSIASGLGLLLSGIAVARARRWTRWRRWAPLAAGVCLFLVVMPGLFLPFVVGRLGIAAWMLTFAALGWALIQEDLGRVPDKPHFAERPVVPQNRGGFLMPLLG